MKMLPTKLPANVESSLSHAINEAMRELVQRTIARADAAACCCGHCPHAEEVTISSMVPEHFGPDADLLDRVRHILRVEGDVDL